MTVSAVCCGTTSVRSPLANLTAMVPLLPYITQSRQIHFTEEFQTIQDFKKVKNGLLLSYL